MKAFDCGAGHRSVLSMLNIGVVLNHSNIPIVVN
jgi:hypothetical protein